MKCRSMLAYLALVAVVSTSGLVAAEAEEQGKKFAATCPVSGQPAKEKSVLEVGKGLKVYFCCDNCPKAFKKDSAKFDLKVRQQLLETGQIVQVGCPVSGGPVDESTMVEVGKTKAGFCCEKCLAKYNKASDDDKLKILFADLPKAYTRQTLCPVSGRPINPEASVEHKGQKVYFCCPGCPQAFTENPAKFEAKLPQLADKEQGLSTELKEKS